MNLKTYEGLFNIELARSVDRVGEFDLPRQIKTNSVPNKLISFDKSLNSSDFDSWVHFYKPDVSFVRLWRNPWKYLSHLSLFEGVISPDFSIVMGLPLYRQVQSICNSRELGAFLLSNGIDVIPNVRWGDERTYEYAFTGVDTGGTVSVGAFGTYKNLKTRDTFNKGFYRMVSFVKPKHVLIYGTVDDALCDFLKSNAVDYTVFETELSEVFREKGFYGVNQ